MRKPISLCWMIGIGLGFLWLTTIGLVSNFIPRLIGAGVDLGRAIPMLTAAALIGIVGSYIWGLPDLKFGTKRACLIYGVWYLVALLIMIFSNGSMGMVWAAAVFFWAEGDRGRFCVSSRIRPANSGLTGRIVGQASNAQSNGHE